MSRVLEITRTWDGAPVGPDEAVRLAVALDDEGLTIEVDAPFHGDPPPPGPPGPTWALWEQEVVELFVLGPGDRYTEIELGPHGHHLVLRLEGVRQIVERELPIPYEAVITGGRWRAVARLPPSLLPEGPYRINATAIHGRGEGRRYLSWAPLPAEKPDFHQLHRFLPFK